MARKPSDPVKLNLRFNEALRANLEKQAVKNNRSMNEEIVRRLEESFHREEIRALVEKLAQDVTVQVTEVIKQGVPLKGDKK
jgi:hypothetical protein